MPKISIITRCRNRLEYTAQVLDAVKRNTLLTDYEHIIVDNYSSDGTYEWFTWLQQNCSHWYDKVKYLRMERNTGDWGGMLAGFQEASGDFIVQLDNDIIPCSGWLTALAEVLINSQYKAVMLKRDNVAWKLKPQSRSKMIGDYEVCKIERVVACYMMRTEHFSMISRAIPESQGLKSKYIMAKMLNPLGKILNRTCIELQADDQRVKYSPKNPEIWEKV